VSIAGEGGWGRALLWADLRSRASRAFPDARFRASLCIFSRCRRIRNTRLVDQPVILSLWFAFVKLSID